MARRTLSLRQPLLTGADVRKVQAKVGVPQDGIYGPRTEQKVIAWQIKHDLEPDGVVGPMTWVAMFGGEVPVPAPSAGRAFPNVVVRRNVACQSSRNGARPQLIVLHSTEGQNVPDSAADLAGLAAFFDRLTTQASSHVATDSDGNSSRMVPDDMKAWTCAGFNPVSLNIEQIGFAAQKEWATAELRETARWIAYWSRKHNIPIREAAVMGGAVTRTGVIYHSALGAFGGGHSDPGAGYPLEKVLDYARDYLTAQDR